MTFLIFIVIACALLVGFLVLTDYEIRRGARFFAKERTRLDERIDRIEFIMTHVDLAAFVRDEVRHLAAWMSHVIVHLSLQAVRAAERLLTRLIRYLRSKHVVDAAPRENVREFVKTLSDFKGSLKATHPEIVDDK
ncbi:hypothetical protein EXS57_03220 [Candidatus Kaiserbacteria bacterium]|nr:hypothetical protein [Candidatus Kaiserbacteria bacterium]